MSLTTVIPTIVVDLFDEILVFMIYLINRDDVRLVAL